MTHATPILAKILAFVHTIIKMLLVYATTGTEEGVVNVRKISLLCFWYGCYEMFVLRII